MELLNTYLTERIDTDNYKLTYYFPDNCDISFTQKDGVYSVEIKLQKGQTQPSSNYISDTINCTQYNGQIEIVFVQQIYDPTGNGWGDGTAIRPKMKILIDG
ncbi:hypothetical protein H9X57_17225 [Flavobacterium piscinae]|uniref:Uncharacterized protein n=1 Tax=Flavobacterium piscinae TaxID=2506424 RepID=A0A4Q1KPH4_9FLAO|nr:hypothetical protein [Flavobacterium piscinae]MBC8884485.1 hypothetical protein [Flavobacterium piscinae]RXR31742.1 hypothetical protein EQG68_08675 [Flavobacterium piscinae]